MPAGHPYTFFPSSFLVNRIQNPTHLGFSLRTPRCEYLKPGASSGAKRVRQLPDVAARCFGQRPAADFLFHRHVRPSRRCRVGAPRIVTFLPSLVLALGTLHALGPTHDPSPLSAHGVWFVRPDRNQSRWGSSKSRGGFRDVVRSSGGGMKK